MKNLKAFFVIVLFLGLIFSFQEVLATTYDSCEDFCDSFSKQYDFSECIEEDGEEITRACDPYPQFDDSKYCYYDCAIKNSGDVGIEDCVSHFCLCTKKVKCDSSENNCYNGNGCVSCEKRSATSSCEKSTDCCKEPDALMCDSETKLCYNPNNNFHCESNRKCYSDEECMSGKCDFKGTGECECSDRGEECEKYYGASSDSQCVDDFLCNDKYSVCYNEDLNLKEKEKCYHDSECKSDSCNFNEQGTSGVCDGADGGGDDGGDNGSEPEEPEPKTKEPPKFGTCEYYCEDTETREPPEGMVCICNPLGADSFEDIINNIINFIWQIGLVLAPLMIVWAGGLYVTSGGDPRKVETARTIILYTLTGLLIIMLSKGFVAVIKQLLGT